MLRIFVSLTLASVSPAALALGQHEHHQHSKPVARTVDKPAAATPPRAATGSAFARYQRFTPDEPLKDWRAVNDAVAGIGGWRAYAMEAARAIEAEKKAAGGKP